MKKYLFFCLLCSCFSASAQLNPAWVNNFCCFDSVAPHTFSYPIGVVVKNDSIVIAYYEDDSLKVKIINSNTGTDLADFYYANDIMFPPFYYGGNFIECDSGYICATSAMDSSNNSFIIFKVIDRDFNLIHTKVVSTGHLEYPMTDLLKSPLGDSCFYLAHLSDSLRVFEFNISDFSSRTFAFEKGNNDELSRHVYFNSLGELIVPGLHMISSFYFMSLNRIDVVAGIMLQTEFSSQAFSYANACYQEGDSIRFAFKLMPGDSLITFQSVSLNDLNYSNRRVTNAITNGGIRNYCTSPSGSKLYVESDGNIFQFNPGFALSFERNLSPYSFSMYNRSALLFDQSDNPLIFNSYINNAIINEDLIYRRIDHNSGNTIDSLVYNDSRNTPDIAITQFYDSNNRLNLVYANDFDDAFILQEETQLNIIQLDPLVDLQNEIPQAVIKMYPNPATTKLNFSDKNLVGSQVMLYNTIGKSLKAFILNSEQQIDISDLKTGIYFLQFKKENVVFSNAKFIKIDK